MSSSKSTSTDAAVPKTTSSNAGDSCTWYAGENCTLPRTGFDCLNELLETDECAIDPNGACVSMSVYEQYLSDKAYYEPASKYFPASNYTYCSTNDSVCLSCIAEWTSSYETMGTTGSTTYCTGSDGCVCVAAVEVPTWQQTVIANQCSSSSDGVSSSNEFSSGTRICIILAMCVGAFMILAVFAVRRCLQAAGHRRFGPGSIPRAPPTGPQLSLAGWKSLREKLIETEHGFVKGDTARLDATVRSAEAMADAPTVTVEVAPAPCRRPPSPAFDAHLVTRHRCTVQRRLAKVRTLKLSKQKPTMMCGADRRRCPKVSILEEPTGLMASNSNSNDTEVTVPSNVSTTDSCTWYADKSCEKSRTCFDCLNVGIVGDTCVVGDMGQCLSSSEQEQGKTYYAATSLSYCAASDQKCSSCRFQWLQEYAASGEVKSSAMCVGENDCICLAVCERETRNSLVIQAQCPAYETAKVGSIMLVIAMGVASFIVFSMLTFCLRRLLRCAMPWLDGTPDQSLMSMRRRPRSPRGPQLTLSGWKSMREKLIETEHGNGTPSAGPAGVMRIQLSATEGTSVIVEEGDGFRPASPSQHPTTRPEDLAPALAMLR